MTIHILLAEDRSMVRGALVALLEMEDDFQVVCQVTRGDEIVAAAREHTPHIALIDVDLPGLDGLTAATHLHAQVPACRTLILTSLGRPGTLRRALTTGVDGYLLKDTPLAELAATVRHVTAGRRVIDPQLALAMWPGTETPLTERETDVLRLAAEGADARGISLELRLSAGAIRDYLRTIVRKLNARNRMHAIGIARDAGWLL